MRLASLSGPARLSSGPPAPPLVLASNEDSLLLNIGDGRDDLSADAAPPVPPYGVRSQGGARGVVAIVHQWDRAPRLAKAILDGEWPGLSQV